MSTSSPPAGRKPRADAARNRERVLTAARVLLAERGEAVRMPEVARAAGVGVGTVYRHFPTLRELVEAVAEQRFAEIGRFARTECLAGDPGAALAMYLRHVGEVLEGDPGLSAAIEVSRGGPGSEPRGAARDQLAAGVTALIERGQAAGTIRDDCTTADVYLLSGCLSGIIRTGSGDWRRFLDIALAGLRPH